MKPMRSHLHKNAVVILFFCAVAWAGCSTVTMQSGTIPGTSPGKAAKGHHGRFHPNAIASPYIQHVVIVIQENRSFNTLFGGPNPFPSAATTDVGYEHNGNPVNLSKIELEDTGADIDHHYQDAITAVNRNGSNAYQMNGFDEERLATGSSPEPTAAATPYKYVDYNETKPYWAMANSWVLGDNFYPTEFGPSFTAHLNLIAGTTETSSGIAAADFPSTWSLTDTDCESQVPPPAHVPAIHADGSYYQNGPYPCFWQFATMADLLDKYGISWRYYAPTVSDLGGRIWSEFDAIERVRCGTTGFINSPCTSTGTDWSNVKTPSRQILSDVAGANGVLKNVTWVVPTYANSDHQGSQSARGPYWVASVVNAIGKSKFWNSTVIVVLWDDWGGWYDEAPPPQYDFRGKGIRTPVIIISPYSLAGGTVSHYQYEPGSILNFIEVAFDLPALDTLQYYYYNNNLGYTDSTAKNSIGEGSLDFTQTPRPFTPVPTPNGYDMNYFMNQPESAPAPDSE